MGTVLSTWAFEVFVGSGGTLAVDGWSAGSSIGCEIHSGWTRGPRSGQKSWWISMVRCFLGLGVVDKRK